MPKPLSKKWDGYSRTERMSQQGKLYYVAVCKTCGKTVLDKGNRLADHRGNCSNNAEGVGVVDEAKAVVVDVINPDGKEPETKRQCMAYQLLDSDEDDSTDVLLTFRSGPEKVTRA